MLPKFRSNLFRQVAKNQHPLVGDVQMDVGIILVVFLRSRRNYPVPGKHDSRRIDPATLGKSQGPPILIDHKVIPGTSSLLLQVILRPQGNPGCKLKTLKIGSVVTRRLQPKKLEGRGHIFGCSSCPLGPCEASFHLIRGQVAHMETQILGADFRLSGLQVGEGFTGFCLIAPGPSNLDDSIQAQKPASLTIIPPGHKQLRSLIPRAGAGPNQLSPIGVEHGQTIEAFPGGHTNRITFPLSIHQVKFKVLKSVQVGGKDQVVPRRMKIGRPGHGSQTGDLSFR